MQSVSQRLGFALEVSSARICHGGEDESLTRLAFGNRELSAKGSREETIAPQANDSAGFSQTMAAHIRASFSLLAFRAVWCCQPRISYMQSDAVSKVLR